MLETRDWKASKQLRNGTRAFALDFGIQTVEFIKEDAFDVVIAPENSTSLWILSLLFSVFRGCSHRGSNPSGTFNDHHSSQDSRPLSPSILPP